MNRYTIGTVVVSSVLASAAMASVSNNSPLSGPFLPGVGNSNTNFVVSTVTESTGNVVELGIKGKERFFGDTLPISGNVYTAQPGYSPTSGGDPTPATNRAWWNMDFSANLGSRTPANTTLTLTIVDIQGDVFNASGPATVSLAQDSWNIGFGFISGPLGGFNPFTPGDYTVTIAASDLATSASLGSATAIIRVVPAPGAAALLGLGGLMVARRRR